MNKILLILIIISSSSVFAINRNEVIRELPNSVKKYIFGGCVGVGGDLVVFSLDGKDGIIEYSNFLLGLESYPDKFQNTIWFGGNGSGSYTGWMIDKQIAVLWHPADEDQYTFSGSVEEVWQFIADGYGYGAPYKGQYFPGECR